MKTKPAVQHIAAATALVLTLGACNNQADAPPAPEPADLTEPEEIEEPVSIIRSDVEVEPNPLVLEPLEQRISFDGGEAQLSVAALAELREVVESEQVKAGGPITLRGHTDSAGRDDANIRASRQRAERVRDWLVENGIAEDRITVIAMGEQNPARPNAKPDGTPNETGRAFNRRVDLSVALPPELEAAQEEDAQSLIERVSAED
ncbi:MAG: OmpA family protein [Pontixanthobacter sp.]